MPRTRPTAERIHDARRHAKARASARLGLVLEDDELRQVVADIQQGRSTLLWQQSRTRSWHLVRVQESNAVAVYGKGIKSMHTFLTLEMARATLREHAQTEALAKMEGLV